MEQNQVGAHPASQDRAATAAQPSPEEVSGKAGIPCASIRAAFVDRFGEDQAALIEEAAEGHGNGINNENRGSDPFKWALLIAIGYQCMELDDYRNYHRITAPWDELKQWIIDHANLAEHDGDCDYLSLLAGTYNDFVTSAEQVSA